MRALDRKLLRELWRMKGQVVTIALVLASGVASIVALVGTHRALAESRDAYYAEYDFPDVFVHLEQAPESIGARLADLPGVASVETRLVEPITLSIPGMIRPASGRAVSLPGGNTPSLHALALERGRPPDPARSDEILLLASFADAHGLQPGDRLDIVLGGGRLRLRIAGLAMSPEWIYPAESGLGSDKDFGVIWMPRRALAAAAGKHGAFDDATLRLIPGADPLEVIDAVDRTLAPWGGLGAYDRSDQSSNRFVASELEELEVLATEVPLVFMLVAAFLLHIVLGRLVQLQREAIAVLRALGYRRLAIARHVAAFASVIVLLGALLGIAAGAYLGGNMVELYGPFFHFPDLRFRFAPDLAAIGLAACGGAAMIGALSAVWKAMRLVPAEAMRPPAPARYRKGILSRLGLARLAGPIGRMVVREIERRPVVTGMSILGVAFAGAIVVLGRFSIDSIDFLMDVQFGQTYREDVAVVLVKPAPRADLGWFRHAPGVIAAEPMRSIPVRLHGRHGRYDTTITGLDRGGRLRQVLDSRARPVAIPETGVLLTRLLGERLGVAAGDRILVERKDGDRREFSVTVAGLVDEVLGMNAYMDLDALAHDLGEEPMLSGVLLDVEGPDRDALFRALAEMPTVVLVIESSALRDYFEAQTGELVLVFTMIVAGFGVVIAAGVIYNNARTSLSERSRDLATLRVLGYTRDEVATVMLGQLAFQVALAVPIGMLFGQWIAIALMTSVDPEQFRLTVVISSKTYGFATLVVLGASIGAALVVRRRLDALDLVGALKARD